MKVEFSALNDFVKSFKPGHHVRMIRKDYSLIAKMMRYYGTKDVHVQSFRMEMLDDLFDPVATAIEKLLPSVLDQLRSKYGVSRSSKTFGSQLRSKYGGSLPRQRNRAVFLSKFVVVKVPVNERGLIDIFHEAHLYSKKDDENLAPCKLILVNELPVLMMQKLDTNIGTRPYPEWAKHVDARQVGLNRKGKFKAYDYGIV